MRPSDLPDSPAELIPIAVSRGMLPRYLYKYRSPGEGTKAMFSANTVWFANPHEFNDPFDCQITADTTNTRLELERFMLKTRPELQWRPSDLTALMEVGTEDPKAWHQMVNDSIRSIVNTTGISCFSENFDNLLMWAHYATSHSGVCLKFDLLADPSFFVTPVKVLYSADYPLYNQVRGDDTLAEKLLNTKSIDWAYEQEWRIIKPDEQGACRFSKQALVEVMFGCRAEENFINEIKSLAGNAGMDHLIYKKAQVSRTHYALNFIES